MGGLAVAMDGALYRSQGSRQGSTIYPLDSKYWVMNQLLPQYQRDLAALSHLSVRSQSGALVPLAAVASLGTGLGPLTVNHAGQIPAVTLSFNLRPGASLGEAVDAVVRAARTAPPSTIT